MTHWIADAGLRVNVNAAIFSFKPLRVLSTEEVWYKPCDNDRSNSSIAIRSLLSLTKRLSLQSIKGLEKAKTELDTQSLEFPNDSKTILDTQSLEFPNDSKTRLDTQSFEFPE